MIKKQILIFLPKNNKNKKCLTNYILSLKNKKKWMRKKMHNGKNIFNNRLLDLTNRH